MSYVRHFIQLVTCITSNRLSSGNIMMDIAINQIKNALRTKGLTTDDVSFTILNDVVEVYRRAGNVLVLEIRADSQMYTVKPIGDKPIKE